MSDERGAEREERSEKPQADQSEAGAAGHGAEPRGKRTEDGRATYLLAIAEALWEEMTEVYRLDPEAVW